MRQAIRRMAPEREISPGSRSHRESPSHNLVSASSPFKARGASAPGPPHAGHQGVPTSCTPRLRPLD